MNPDGTGQKAVVDDVQVVDYEWSPDGKWIVYARQDGSFASELFVVNDGHQTLDFLFKTGVYASRDPMVVPRVVLLDLNLPTCR